ncbi:hypothetical protein EDB81DRAFT_910194, partial [Dactylonectria macrodidyma]
SWIIAETRPRPLPIAQPALGYTNPLLAVGLIGRQGIIGGKVLHQVKVGAHVHLGKLVGIWRRALEVLVSAQDEPGLVVVGRPGARVRLPAPEQPVPEDGAHGLEQVHGLRPDVALLGHLLERRTAVGHAPHRPERTRPANPHGPREDGLLGRQAEAVLPHHLLQRPPRVGPQHQLRCAPRAFGALLGAFEGSRDDGRRRSGGRRHEQVVASFVVVVVVVVVVVILGALGIGANHAAAAEAESEIIICFSETPQKEMTRLSRVDMCLLK